MMNEYLIYFLAFAGGLALGFFYFGTLWLSINVVKNKSKTALWLFFSFILRIVITIAGLYFIFGDNLVRIILAMIGFIIARTILIKSLGEAKTKLKKGGTDSAVNSR